MIYIALRLKASVNFQFILKSIWEKVQHPDQQNVCRYPLKKCALVIVNLSMNRIFELRLRIKAVYFKVIVN